MSEVITTAIAQRFRLPSNLTFTAKDPHDSVSGRTITVAAGYYWLWAAKGAGSGSLTSPWSFVTVLEAALNTGSGGGNYWTVSILASGKISIACSDTGELQWSSGGGQQVANVVGFTQATHSFTTSTITAASLPLYAVYSICRAEDTGWTSRSGSVATVQREDGTVDAIRSGYLRWTRSFRSRFHPSTTTDATSLGAASSPYYSARHVTTASITATDTLATTLTPPWSVTDWLNTCAGLPLAFVTNWVAYVAGTYSFDVVYLSPDTITGEERSAPTVANWSQRRDTTALRFSAASLGETTTL